MSIDRRKYMSMEEARQLRIVTEARAKADIQAGRVTGVRTWMLVDLVLLTGLRVSEIVMLRYEHVDLERGFLTVFRLKRRKRKKKKRGVIARLLRQKEAPKPKPEPEPLAIDPYLAEHLRQYIAWTGQTQGPLFVGSRGPLTSRGLQEMWKAAIKRAGLPSNLSIHKGRHTLAVHLLPGTNLRQVQLQLGHLDPKTTAMYADVTFKQMQDGLTGLYD